ncbi:hypothetical protein [Micromonospora sp. NBC_01813]|uniref:hypothetical protein n=1 Tax=Micromonospora sp. NBC_01813 TaxID=2975988 RepID=UPI002DD8DDE7|nr:hypothetical protein [Micromonospora sp. NBC_01813]WSA11510.1 hypothetical protein OG958_12430 [Micromonospora sp. NBC_01813]
MTKVAKEALSPEQVAELPRVYLMPAEEVAAFQESLMVASEASDRGDRDAELEALWRLVQDTYRAFQDCTIVKARIR